MKRNDISELKNKPKEELMKMLNDVRTKLREANFDLEAGKLKNVKSLKVLKKDIARILTFINQ